MTDTTNKPVDDSKEELTEAELDQVAGGRDVFGFSSTVAKKHTQPEKGTQPENSHCGV
jgi:hypothetical protein